MSSTAATAATITAAAATNYEQTAANLWRDAVDKDSAKLAAALAAALQSSQATYAA